MRTTFCVCDRSRGPSSPIFNVRYIEHVNTVGTNIVVFFYFTVQHKPGKLHVVPDTPLRMFAFEHHQEVAVFRPPRPFAAMYHMTARYKQPVFPDHIRSPLTNWLR